MNLDLELYPFQIDILKSIMNYNYTIVNCSRRVGKSYALAAVSMLKALNKPNQHILIIAPTQTMSINTFWKPLLDRAREINPAPTVQVMEKEIRFHNGSVISLGSCDKIDKLRGRSPNPNLIVIDEFAFIRTRDAEPLFEEVLKPYMTVREANCKICVISTPKGYNYFQKLCSLGNNPENSDWNVVKYTCWEARPDNKLEYQKEQKEMDPKRFSQEYLCEFLTEGNSVFINFDDLLNLDHEIKSVQKDEPIVLAVDQNVGLMSCIVARVKSHGDLNRIEIIDEHEGKFKDIPSFISGIKELYPDNRITIVPDSSMASRSAAAGIGNDSISQLKQAGFTVRMDKKNPQIIDSVNVANGMLLSGEGKRLVKIHPKCHKLIDAIKSAQWNASTGNNLVKDNVTDHLQDAFRYLTWQFRKRQGFTLVRNYNTF